MIGQKIRHYEIREYLGRGAMGTVYRAYDEALDRDVAIKFLSTHAAPTPRDVERFHREARAAAGSGERGFQFGAGVEEVL